MSDRTPGSGRYCGWRRLQRAFQAPRPNFLTLSHGLVLCVLLSDGFAPKLHSQIPSQSSDQITISHPNANIIPIWQDGVLMSIGSQTDNGSSSLLIDTDNGRATKTLRVHLGEAHFLKLENAIQGPDGSIDVIGYAVKSDGTIAHFLGQLNQNGIVKQLIRTNPYIPREMCLTTSGTIWTLGNLRKRSQSPSTRLLREWFWDKGMIRAAVTKTQISQGESGVTSDNRLLCLKDSEAIISLTTNSILLVSADGTIVNSFGLVPGLTKAVLTGAAFIQPDSIAVTAVRFSERHKLAEEVWITRIEGLHLVSVRKALTFKKSDGKLFRSVVGVYGKGIVVSRSEDAIATRSSSLTFDWIPLGLR